MDDFAINMDEMIVTNELSHEEGKDRMTRLSFSPKYRVSWMRSKSQKQDKIQNINAMQAHNPPD